jgi:hypothetical protein
MKTAEFEHFLKFAEDHLTDKSDPEKIQTFMSWCKENGIEEVILRLSSENKGGLGENFFLDFTTSRIIVSKKKFTRKFVDVGYIAGMAPFSYMLLSKNLKLSDLRKGSAIDPKDILGKNRSNFFIPYSDIKEVIIRKGLESIVTNMLGSIITRNFLTVKTSSKKYDYGLPVNKNGTFEQIHYWLGVIMPVKVLAR